MSKGKLNKFMLGVTAAAMAASIAAPAVSADSKIGSVGPTEAQVQLSEVVYGDVSSANSHFVNIYKAREYGLLTGYPNNLFKPSQSLSRSNVVKALGKYILAVNGMTISQYDVSGIEPFADIPATHPDKELYNYSLIVKNEGIFEGSNNNLLPGKLITRQQMAKVLVNAFQLGDVEDVEPIVKDNAKAYPEFVPYINILSENGVTVVENFNPTGTTQRDQFASFLVRALEAVYDLEAPTFTYSGADPIELKVGDTFDFETQIVNHIEASEEVDVYGILYNMSGDELDDIDTSVPGSYELEVYVEDASWNFSESIYILVNVTQ